MKVLDLGNEMADELLEVLGSMLGGSQHLLMVCLLTAVITRHNLVGDEGQTQDTQAAVTSHHHLWHGTHTLMERSSLFQVHFHDLIACVYMRY